MLKRNRTNELVRFLNPLVVLVTAVAAVASGTYEADDYGQYSFMEHGGGSLAMDTSLIPAEIVAAVKAKEAAIMDGSFTVVVNDEAPVSDN